MKLHKLISRTVLATALLGTIIGGAFSLNASADNKQDGGPVYNNSPSVSPQTKSQFAVNGGFLSLDNVPTLNFGNDQNVDEHASNVLKLNANNNQNNSGLLEVTDYRNNPNNNNWTLRANMSNNVGQSDGSGNNQNINNQWQMNLFNSNIATNMEGNQVPNLNSTTQLTNNNQNSDIMSKRAGSGNDGYGVNKITYNNGNDANLIIPNVSRGTYKADVTWTLGTDVTAGSNYGGSSPSPSSPTSK